MKVFLKKILKVRFLGNSGHIFSDIEKNGEQKHYSLMGKNKGSTIFLPKGKGKNIVNGNGIGEDFMYVFVCKIIRI